MRPTADSASMADFFMLISIVLMVASLGLGAGVFLYQQYVDTSNTSKLKQLGTVKDALEPSFVEKCTKLDDRMQVAGKLLSRHEAFSLVFSALQQTTIKTVSFKSLMITSDDGGAISFKMDGVTNSINSIALQADLFGKTGFMKDIIFSGITRSSDGVHFSVTGELSPADIRYAQVVSAAVPASDTSSGPPLSSPSVSSGGEGGDSSAKSAQTN